MSGTAVDWNAYAYGARYEDYQHATDELNARHGNAWPCSINLVHGSADRFDPAAMDFLSPTSVRDTLGVSVPWPFMACEACVSELNVRRWGVV